MTEPQQFDQHYAQYGDTVLLVSKDRDSYVRTLTVGATFSTQLGNIPHDALISLPYGSTAKTHLGHVFYLLPPQVPDLIAHARHETAIIQPKDLGYIALKLGVRPGMHIVEAGTGSGALTLLLASLVGDEGHVYTYERKEALREVATKNLNRVNAAHRVTFTTGDIADGFNVSGADALFMDVTNPWDYLSQAWAALAGGGVFGTIVPTINQVITVIDALYTDHWFMLEIEEILLRHYKINPGRIRPEDQMVGHTGYLIFARAVNSRAKRQDDEPLSGAEDR